jgi:hypothetical protein
VVVLQWRGCLSAIEYGDNGAVENLREEADELPCRYDDQPETASSNSSLSPPDPPETTLFTINHLNLRALSIDTLYHMSSL